MKESLMNSKGFTLIEVLFALCIISISVVLCFKSFSLLKVMNKKDYIIVI